MKIWHPFTQAKTAPNPIKMVRGEGAYLFDSTGNGYLDMISSWWVNILGHCNAEIAEAIAEQARTLEHVIFAGYSHDPAEELCERLSRVLPSILECFFFSDNGSTAVEVALKMAYQYFRNAGISHKNIFVSLSGAYHGDTLGAMGLAGSGSNYHSTFSEFFFPTFSIDFPENEAEENLALSKFQIFLEQKGENVCALILEPIVQGAAGMRIYRPEFLEAIVEEARKYDILIIFDEVMTGFYRTGKFFAMDWCRSTPDLICLSKGITGGFLPLSLTITTSEIYNRFLSDDWKKAFVHGHSYTANPIACRAACKVMEILERNETQKKIHEISPIHAEKLSKLTGSIRNKRHIGTLAAFDVETPEIAKEIQNNMLKNGVMLRPLGKTLYLLPPYCIRIQDLNHVYSLIQKFLPCKK